MNIDHDFEFFGGKLDEGFIPQDPRVVDHDIDLTKGIESGLDDRLAAFRRGDRIVVGHGGSAGFLALLDHLIGHAAAATGSIGGPSQVVDHHLAATAGKFQCVGATQAASGAGNHGHTIVKSNFSHGCALL